MPSGLSVLHGLGAKEGPPAHLRFSHPSAFLPTTQENQDYTSKTPHSFCHGGALLGSSRIAIQDCYRVSEAFAGRATPGRGVGAACCGSVQIVCASWAADSEVLLTCPMLCPSIWAAKPTPSE